MDREEQLEQIIKALLNTCKLNLDEVDPHTRDTINEAIRVLEKRSTYS